MRRSPTRRDVVAGIGAAAMLLPAGCGTVRETMPPRSAHEQFLISTAVDRAVAKLPADLFSGKRAFLETENLDCIDRPYVVQCLRTTLRRYGVRIADSRDAAELVLEVAAGALSINRRDFLVGLPALPLPLPFADQVLKFPELPLFKMITYDGRAKLLFSPFDAETDEQTAAVPLCYGESRETYWWLFFIGPVTSSTLPKEEK